MSSSNLLKEAKELIARSRSHVVECENEEMKKGTIMTTATPTQAAALYSAGKSVVEVAQELGVTYGKARKLIADSGTPIRNTSDRLKGKTRRKK